MLGRKSKLFFGVSVGVLIVATILATWGFPKIVQQQISKNLRLDNDSTMFEKWREVPVPLTFKVHLFTVNNTDDVNEGEKPILQEVGPYVYKEYRVKTIIGYGENDTIKYMLKKSFHFDKEASGRLSEDDEVTVINYSYMAAMLTVQQIMPAAAVLVNQAMGTFFPNLTDPFLRVKVKDLLFDGIFLNCVGDDAALKLICGKIKMERPVVMRPAEDGTGYYFSMFNHLNSSESGPYTVNRGIDNIKELGHVVAYKDMPIMRNWGDPYCGQINGSDSTIFPPPMDGSPPEKIYTFEPEICRSFYASLRGEREIFNISAYYYEIDEMLLASKSANPNNKCFCKKNWSGNHDGCLLMGIMNLTPCKGAPALISLPHFYLASEELLEFFDGGVKPEREKHNSFVYLDATTGVVLKGYQRLQFNIEMRNMKGVPQLENVQTGVFPFLWIEEGAELTKELQQELLQGHKLLSYVEAIRWIILGLAVVLCLASAVYVARSSGFRNNSVSFILRPNHLDSNKR